MRSVYRERLPVANAMCTNILIHPDLLLVRAPFVPSPRWACPACLTVQDTPSRPPCALEEALTNAGIKEFDLSGGGGMSLGGWPMAPMEGGALDAPNGSMTGAGIGLEMVGGGGDDVEEDGVALSTGGSEVCCLWCSFFFVSRVNRLTRLTCYA